MAKDFSPEEKLLNLIKKKAVHRAERGHEGLPKEGRGDSRKRETLLPSPILDWNNIARLENIKALNMFLFIALIGIILYFIADILLISPKEFTPLEEKRPKRGIEVEELEKRPYSYYLKGVGGKDLFKPFENERPETAVPEIPVEELMADLTLLGIVSGDPPQAIIENKKQRKTFFLKEGQTAGGVSLKKIEDGSATVMYKGEEFTLML